MQDWQKELIALDLAQRHLSNQREAIRAQEGAAAAQHEAAVRAQQAQHEAAVRAQQAAAAAQNQIERGLFQLRADQEEAERVRQWQSREEEAERKRREEEVREVRNSMVDLGLELARYRTQFLKQ